VPAIGPQSLISCARASRRRAVSEVVTTCVSVNACRWLCIKPGQHPRPRPPHRAVRAIDPLISPSFLRAWADAQVVAHTIVVAQSIRAATGTVAFSARTAPDRSGERSQKRLWCMNGHVRAQMRLPAPPSLAGATNRCNRPASCSNGNAWDDQDLRAISDPREY